MYLVDTNVISELRRPRPHGAVLAWLKDTPEQDLRLSAVTVGEIQKGIELTRRQDGPKAAEIEAWLDLVIGSYEILPMDAAAFRAWGILMYRRSDTLIEDAMIAATALVHGLVIVTRNIADFEQLDVPTLDPFAYRAP